MKSRLASIRSLVLLGAVLRAGGALALPSPVVVYQPASATAPTAYGSERKVFELNNAAGSIVAVYTTAAAELHWASSNDAGATWTDALITTSAYAFTAILDPATNNLHVLYATTAPGLLSKIGYAIGTYAAAPTDPTYAWTINPSALGASSGSQFRFPAAVLATAGGVTYLHVVFGQKESSGSASSDVLWNFKVLNGATTGWIQPDPGKVVTLGSLASTCQGACGPCPNTYDKNPGPIPSIIAADNQSLYVTFWYGDKAASNVYIRRMALTGTAWDGAAVAPYAAFAVGANTAPCLNLQVPSGAVVSALASPAGGQVAFVIPNSAAQETLSYQLLLNNTTCTAWNGPGSAAVAVPGLNVTNAGDGFPSLTALQNGTYYVFLSDSGARSNGNLVYYTYPAGGPLSAKTTFWDDATNAGNRHPGTGLDASTNLDVVWTANTTNPAAVKLDYFGILINPLKLKIAATPADACEGGTVTVTVTAQNLGVGDVTGLNPALDLHAAGGDAVTWTPLTSPAPLATLAAGTSYDFVWTYAATALAPLVTGVGLTQFTGTVDGTYLAQPIKSFKTSTVQAVHAPPGLATAVAVARNPVSTGQTFAVMLTVTDTGSAPVTGVVPDLSWTQDANGPTGVTLVAAPTPSSTDLGAHGAYTFTWLYRADTVATPGSDALGFTATVNGTGLYCGNAATASAAAGPVTVQLPAALDGSVVSVAPAVCTGDTVLVTQTVTNTGVATAAGVTPSTVPVQAGTGGMTLTASPLPLASLAGGAAVVFTWTFTAASAGSVRFTVTTTGADANSGAALTTGPQTSGAASIESNQVLAAAVSAPAFVSVGQTFAVTVTVTDTGGLSAAGVTATVIELSGAGEADGQSGPAPAAVPLAPGGGHQAFGFTCLAAAPGALLLGATATGTVCGAPATAAAAVGLTVQVPAALAASYTAFRSTADVGQPFLVTLTVSNTGEAPATLVAPAAPATSGTAAPGPSAGPTPAGSVTIPGGGFVVFTWTESGASPGLLTFTTTATGQDGNAGFALTTGAAAANAVLIQTPPSLVASAITVNPSPACQGLPVTLTLTVTNYGQATALAVPASATPWLGGTGPLAILGRPAPVTVPGGASALLTWTVGVGTPGIVNFTISVGGTDANTNGPIVAPGVTSDLLTVNASGFFVAAIAAPPSVSVGQTFAVVLTVTNAGADNVTNATPALAVGPGGAAVTPLTGPVPTGPLTVAPGVGQSFTWTFAAAAAGPAAFTATVTGQSCGGAAVRGVGIAPVALQTPAALSTSVWAVPSPRDIGQAFLVVAVVTDTGQAAATGVAPGPLGPAGVAVTVNAGPSPAGPVTIPGGGSAIFTWTVTGLASGNADVTLTATGNDGNAGWAVVAPAATSAPAVIQTPAALAGYAAVTPGQSSAGQTLLATLTVTNTGQATATALIPSISTAGSSAGVGYIGGPLGFFQLAGGASRTFTWTYGTSSPGTARFTLGLAGNDLNTGGAVAVTSVRLGTVQVPAAVRAALAVSTTTLTPTGTLLLMLTVTNTGGATVTGLTPPAPGVLGLGGFAVTGPPPAGPFALPGGATLTWTYTLTATAAGLVSFATTVTGLDGNSGLAVSGASGHSVPVEVGQPSLAVVVFTAAPLTTGLQAVLTVTMTVSNTGRFVLAGLTPTALAIVGDARAQLLTGPVPGSAASVPPGGTATFTWTWLALRGGLLQFSGGAATTNGGSAPLAVSNAVAVTEGGTTLGDMIVYPNPASRNVLVGGTVKFRQMPPGTLVRIYTIAGELVWEQGAPAIGFLEWDTRNSRGIRVTPGVYLVRAQDKGGNYRIVKLEVID